MAPNPKSEAHPEQAHLEKQPHPEEASSGKGTGAASAVASSNRQSTSLVHSVDYEPRFYGIEGLGSLAPSRDIPPIESP
jgi:hypothetical protein